MFYTINSTILKHKELAYSFVDNSGLEKTAEKTGHTNQAIFGSNGDLFYGTGMTINTALSLLGVVFLVLTVYGGITWMTAEGDETKVEKAKKTITQAVIGLVIVLAAYAISLFVINALSGSTLK
jgi:hypothetical protein